jgi:hypothetical protein
MTFGNPAGSSGVELVVEFNGQVNFAIRPEKKEHLPAGES